LNKKYLNNGALVVVIVIVIIGGLVLVNYQFAKNNPGGNDFLAHYVGTRALIYQGISPYGDQVAEEIQIAVFGRLAQEGEIEHRVVYPIYSTLIFAPFALIQDYIIARVAWMTFLEISLIVTSLLALNLFSWKPNMGVLAFYFLFSIIWYYGFRGLVNGNAVVLVSLFFTGALVAIKERKDRIAGLLLAFSTIKPNLAILVVVFVLFWCMYQKKNQIILSFFCIMIALVLGGMLVIPNWIVQNLWELIKYPAYNPAGSIGEIFGSLFPEIELPLRLTISIGFGLLLVYEWWHARQKEFESFLWTICLTIVVSQWIGIQTDPGNFVILFTPFIMVLAYLDKRWKKYGTVVISSILGVVLIGLWVLFLVTLDYDYQPMQSSIMFFPFPGIVLVGLYWIKWWVTGSKKLLRNDSL